MTRLATSLTTAAVALVVVAQVAVSPSACCLIRAALFGGEACCRVSVAAAEPAERSCCHGPSAQAAEVDGGADGPAVPDADCLWCSAGPKVVANDRVVLPDLDVAPAFDSLSAVEPASPAPASRRLVADEPFHRTALAACAWLCVWVI
jgi:hypothetical protein